MGDIFALILLLVGPFCLTFILLSIFGPNHCGGSQRNCKLK